MAPESVRVRLAPSPTGHLHVGTARTALFNELFARHEGGTFIIRIEDTDPERSKPEYEKSILEGLRWLGITWQEGPDSGGAYGPYRQSERRAEHTRAIQQLLDQGMAYIDATNNNVIRLKVPNQAVTFTDLIRGDVTVPSEAWGGDFIIARSLDNPLFHLAVVVDDEAQQITHVLRGEDHLTNTARHILLQRALGYRTPQYAHLPLLLDEERHKLSKRSGETNLLAYRDVGYLPEAMVNYLALLGWNPKNDQEFFSHEELVAAFSLTSIHKGGAIFSLTKLNAVNRHYVRQLPPAALLTHATPFLKAAGLTITDNKYWQAALLTEQPRVNTLQELAQAVSFFAPAWAGEYEPAILVWRKSTPTATKTLLEKTIAFVTDLTAQDFTAATLEKRFLTWIDDHHLGRGDTLWPVRVALTGREHSPGPFEVAAVLGKALTLKRLEIAFGKL